MRRIYFATKVDHRHIEISTHNHSQVDVTYFRIIGIQTRKCVSNSGYICSFHSNAILMFEMHPFMAEALHENFFYKSKNYSLNIRFLLLPSVKTLVVIMLGVAKK